ncbi:cutinase family protein [Nocardia sp. NPDC003693]
MNRQSLSLTGIRRSALVVAAVCALTAASVGAAAADTPETQIPIDTCPALYALGIQGTGESSPDAAVTTDTGMLSAVFRPMMSGAGEHGLVDRAYVPYEASFGGAVLTGTGVTPYMQSITGGLDRLKSMAKQVVERCSNTRIALAGYSQGAHVASLFAQEVGAGKGVVSADKIAAVALFGDPTRNAGAALFPGKPGQTVPDAAPGTDGTEVKALSSPPQSSEPAVGSGIGSAGAPQAGFGTLAGRVANFCSTGDLACDAPNAAPLVRVVANIASQVELSGGDPINSLRSVAEAVAFTSIKTFTEVVNNDISGTSLTDLSITPQKSISQRVAEASDPRNTSVDIPGAIQALVKIGTIAFNSVVSVVRTVLTATNIAEIATAGLANPLAGLMVLGTKVLGAVTNLVPPTTISKLTGQAFTALVQNVTDNKDLLDVTTWVKYWNTARKHDYANAEGSGFGESPAAYVGHWFAATAVDLSKTAPAGSVPSGGSDKPALGLNFSPSTTVTTTAPGGGQFPLGGDAPSTGPAPTTTGSGAPTTGYPLFSAPEPQVTR